MKLAALREDDGNTRLHLLTEHDRYVAVNALAERASAPELSGLRDVSDLYRLGADARNRLREIAPAAAHLPAVEGPIRLAAPVLHPRAIVCVGLNYDAHIAEAGRTRPDRIVLFAKYPSSLCGHQAEVFRPATTNELDYEGELVAVIGRRAGKVPAEAALDYIGGYTIMNDISARDLQRREPQWIRAKASDGFAPLGPVVVDSAAMPSVDELRIVTTVNGEVRQNESCSMMITQLPELIEHITASLTLEPGDLIATGTPAGVALGMAQPVYLGDGDTVSVRIEGIGELVNTIRV
jgi:2-keto-4-pentenoate hydratase/2-oxohepta-3-ene-1,7-dioic acid hydratase in catechol pathway